MNIEHYYPTIWNVLTHPVPEVYTLVHTFEILQHYEETLLPKEHGLP